MNYKIIHIFDEERFQALQSYKFDEIRREQENEEFNKISQSYIPFYEMPEDVEIFDITDKLLESESIKEARKQLIQSTNRRFFIFLYPSDGLKIKGLISFVPNPQEQRSLIFLRGGNRFFGILNPGNDFMCLEQYTVITTTYRGGVSEGHDEYGGGEDVNDVKNLIDFIPELDKKLGVHFQKENLLCIGSSRGGMQMFLTFARFPQLQARFSKIVSLCGMLDMRKCISNRPDMKKLFIDDYGLKEGVNEEEWINLRDPLLVVEKIINELPILIIQGTKDNRVSLLDGYYMAKKLTSAGNNVTYWEFEEGEHCLSNIKDAAKLVSEWFKEQIKPLA